MSYGNRPSVSSFRSSRRRLRRRSVRPFLRARPTPAKGRGCLRRGSRPVRSLGGLRPSNLLAPRPRSPASQMRGHAHGRRRLGGDRQLRAKPRSRRGRRASSGAQACALERPEAIGEPARQSSSCSVFSCGAGANGNKGPSVGPQPRGLYAGDCPWNGRATGGETADCGKRPAYPNSWGNRKTRLQLEPTRKMGEHGENPREPIRTGAHTRRYFRDPRGCDEGARPW